MSKTNELTVKTRVTEGGKCCLALAISKDLPVVTADKNWAGLTLCEIKVIR